MKVSVVISAYNEEQKIEDCLKSVKDVASEIIVIDNNSIDNTVEKVKKYTSLIFIRENNLMLNVNKNFGFTKTKSEWILNLDADERLSDELSKEILNLKEKVDVNGYFIPRKNFIFGKWIQHTGWYPDYNLRLFRKTKGRFEEKHVHEKLRIEGTTENLESPIVHLNYENISHFLNKMINTYTISEADNLINNGYKYNSIDIVRMPLSEFLKRYFAEEGYKDGMIGFILSLLMGFYHFVVFLRLWEANGYPEEKNIDTIIRDSKKIIYKEFKYWIFKKKIDNEKNLLKKHLLKIKRKITF